MRPFACLYFTCAGIAGFCYDTIQTYELSNRKPGALAYSLGHGTIVGIPGGIFYSVAVPSLLFIDSLEGLRRRYKQTRE